MNLQKARLSTFWWISENSHGIYCVRLALREFPLAMFFADDKILVQGCHGPKMYGQGSDIAEEGCHRLSLRSRILHSCSYLVHINRDRTRWNCSGISTCQVLRY